MRRPAPLRRHGERGSFAATVDAEPIAGRGPRRERTTASCRREPRARRTDAAALDVAGSFEQARDELVRVVAELEQGAPTLEHSLALWERGEALAARCDEWLLGAKHRLDGARAAARRARR